MSDSNGSNGIQYLTDANFESVINSGKPVFIDFWAAWCGPCRIIAPIVEELAPSYIEKAVIAKMDVDENPNVPQRLGVTSIPTLMMFKNGKLVDRAISGPAADGSSWWQAGINGIVLALLASLALQALFSFFHTVAIAAVGERSLADLRRDTYGRLIRLPMTFYAQRRVGELTSRLSGECPLTTSPCWQRCSRKSLLNS